MWICYLKDEVLFALYIFTPLTVDTRAYLSSRALRDWAGVARSLGGKKVCLFGEGWHSIIIRGSLNIGFNVILSPSLSGREQAVEPVGVRADTIHQPGRKEGTFF